MSTKRLFLPGAGGSPDFWRPVGDRLPPAWSKRYVGWPGLGDQPHDPAVTRFDDLVDLADAEMGDDPVDLVAQSMGGVVAMQLALRRPRAVRRIVLCVTSGGLDVAALGAADWRQTYPVNFPKGARFIIDARPDLTADLPRIACPVLLIWGDADPISPVAVGEALAAALPDARLVVLPGGTHDLAWERAAEVAALVEAHLA